MSFTDPEADDVQPDQGQGDGGAGNPAYAEYLSQIPEEARGPAEEAFKAWDANYTRHQQEAAEYRKGWEPYEQAGVTQYRPEDIQAAFQLLNDPQAARAWIDQTYGQPTVEQPPQPEADPYGFVDPAQQQLEQLLEQRLNPLTEQLQQFQSRFEQQDQQAYEQQIAQALDAEVAALKAEHAKDLPEKVQEQFDDLIETFAMKYAEAGADPKQVIARAWADFQLVANALEAGALQRKVDAPAPAEGGGVPDVAPEQFTRIKDVQDMAVQFLRNNRG